MRRLYVCTSRGEETVVGRVLPPAQSSVTDSWTNSYFLCASLVCRSGLLSVLAAEMAKNKGHSSIEFGEIVSQFIRLRQWSETQFGPECVSINDTCASFRLHKADTHHIEHATLGRGTETEYAV